MCGCAAYMNEARKITWLAMWMTALGQAAVTLYLPAFPAITHQLNIDSTAVKTTLTIFLLGYGVSQFFYGPLSDRYGRKPALLVGIVIFSMGCFINIFAYTINLFLWARLLQGLGIGSVITIGRSILRDRFSGPDLSSAASYLSMGFAIGLGFSPIIGAYLQKYFDWRADFVFLFLIGIVFCLVIAKCLPETFTRAPDKPSIPQFLRRMVKEYKKIISDTVFIRFLLGGLFAYGVVIVYNVMTPFLIQNILGYSAEIYGWLAFLVAIPYYTAATINRKLVFKFGSGYIVGFGIALVIFSGLLMAVMTWHHQLSLLMIMIPIMIATFGQALVWPNAISGALQNFSEFPGKASAMLSGLQMLLVSLLSAIMAILPDVQLSLAAVLIGLGILSALVLGKILRKI